MNSLLAVGSGFSSAYESFFVSISYGIGKLYPNSSDYSSLCFSNACVIKVDWSRAIDFWSIDGEGCFYSLLVESRDGDSVDTTKALREESTIESYSS